jgi:hypothetical protein
MSGRIPWSRVAVEGLVIVASILLAFAIDAWWDQIGQREEERVALVGLEADFSGYLDRLEQIRGNNQRRLEAAHRLIDATGPGPSPLSDAEFQSDLAIVVMYTTINLQPGTLGSLLETNRLSWISDVQLRSRLTDWDRNQRFAEEQNEYLVEQSRELDAFLKGRYPMEGILLLTQDPEHDLSEANFRFPARAGALLADVEFANHLSFAADASRLVINRVDVLDDLVDEILGLLHTNGAD